MLIALSFLSPTFPFAPLFHSLIPFCQTMLQWNSALILYTPLSGYVCLAQESYHRGIAARIVPTH